MLKFKVMAFLIATAMVIASSSSVFAQGWFISVGGSGYTVSDSVGTGYLISVGGGYMFNEYWGITASLGFAQYVIEVEKEDEEKEQLNVYELPISIGARFYLSPNAPVNPFLEAGPMAYLTKIEGEDWANTWGGYAMAGIAVSIGAGGIEVWIRYSMSDFEDAEQYRLTYGLGGSFSGR